MITIFFNSLERVVLLVLAGVIALMIFEFLGKISIVKRTLHTERSRELTALFSNALFVFLLLWKISPILFRFQEIIETPILALYQPGGIPGAIVGGMGALIYMLPFNSKHKTIWKESLQADNDAGKERSPVLVLVIHTGIIILLWITVHALIHWGFALWSASRLPSTFPPS